MFITGCLPITDEQERDIIRRVWSCVDESFDASDLQLRSERLSTSSCLEKNKKRKISATSRMRRQLTGDIRDMIIYYDRYELGVAEVGKVETDSTKILNDSSNFSCDEVDAFESLKALSSEAIGH